MECTPDEKVAQKAREYLRKLHEEYRKRNRK